MTLTPTQQEKITALKNAMDGYFVNESDIATSFSDNPSDAKVASEKLMKDSLDSKADKVALNNLNTSNIKIAGEPLTNIWTGATITSQATLNTFINNHIGEIDARLQKEEIVYGSIYKTDSSRVYISGTYNKVCDSVGSQHPFLNEMILFKLPNDLNSSSTKSIKIKVIYYTTSYASSQNFFELPVKYNNVAIKENTFISNTIILLKLNSSNNGFDVVGVFSPNSTGSYTDLTDKPTIPTKTSDLQNDSGFLTSHQDITGKEDKTNKSSSISTDTGSTTKYPTVKAVEDYVETLIGQSSGGNNVTVDSSCVTDFYIDTTTDEWVIETSACSQGEVVTSWSSTLTDTKVPSEKLVKQYVDNLVGSAIQYIIGSGS